MPLPLDRIADDRTGHACPRRDQAFAPNVTLDPPRALGVGLGRSIAAGELSIPVVAAVCGLPDVIVNASVTRRSGR